VIVTGANRNDVTQLLPLVDAIPPIRGTRGRPLRKSKASTQTVAMTPTRIAADFASVESDRSSPGAVPNTVAVSASSVGSLNGLIRGSMVSGVFAFASSADLTFTKHSSN
jgi:hypothetical protein